MRLFKLLIVLICSFCLLGCENKEETYKNGIEITYNLMGGKFQNCTADIKQYYDFTSSGGKIVDPVKLSKDENGITYHTSGYYIENWYKDKEFTQVFDFNTTVTENLTLYANWKPITRHRFIVCHIDKDFEMVSDGVYKVDGEYKETVLGEYNARNEGYFEDTRGYGNKYAGHTLFEYLQKNEDGTFSPMDKSYKHPMKENEDLDVKVYCRYIKGEYLLVKSKDDLKGAFFNKNLYLLNDIDCDGMELLLNGYSKEIQGNGYKISNFKVTRIVNKESTEDLSCYVSIFGKAKDAVIKNVTFDNVTFDVTVTSFVNINKNFNKVFIGTLATSLTDCTVENVYVNGVYKLNINKGVTFDEETKLEIVNNSMTIINKETNNENFKIVEGE